MSTLSTRCLTRLETETRSFHGCVLNVRESLNKSLPPRRGKVRMGVTSLIG